MTPLSRIVALVVVSISIIGLFFLIGAGFVKKNTLPDLGEPDHVAGSFSFTNQLGKQVTEKAVLGKVTIVEYFFTTCPGICKIMNKNLVECSHDKSLIIPLLCIARAFVFLFFEAIWP